MRTNAPSSAPSLVLPKARGRPPTASSRCCSSSAARMRWSPCRCRPRCGGWRHRCRHELCL